MARPRRSARARPKKRARRLGTMLFVLGVLAVLGGTFAAGALTGRLSLRPAASVASPATSAERPAKPAPPPPPTLTFYRELTAPLTPLPPPPRPARPGPKPAGTPGETARRAEAPADAPARAGGAADVRPGAEAGPYTVQVGSYNARAQADALRARLVTGGYEAYVAEGEAGGVTRYRVRVGAFATREEARQAAVRLGSEAQVATYVTVR